MPKLARALTIAALLAPAPVLAADLTIYWQKGFYPEEDTALEALVKRFEQKTGKKVELKLHEQQVEHPKAVAAARERGEPPDIANSNFLLVPRLAYEGALVDLSDVIEPIKDQLSPTALDDALMTNGRTGKRAYYGVPIGQNGINIHVWKSLLEQAGIGMDQIPREWDAFWTFWCDTVQPAVRKATGRNDIWGMGLPMSVAATDTLYNIEQFQTVYGARYMTPDGKLRLDEPKVRQGIAKALTHYTSFYKKGCTPPDSAKWTNIDNNKSFHDQKIVMTINTTLSIPAALRAKRPDDYFKNTTSIEWPLGPEGQRYPLDRSYWHAVVFNDAKHVDTAKEFARLFATRGELGPYIEASLGRSFPAMPALLKTPFWQDPADPHRQMAAKLLSEWPAATAYVYIDPRHAKVDDEKVWEKAVHRVAVEGVSPEQAADEAIARIKAILAP